MCFWTKIGEIKFDIPVFIKSKFEFLKSVSLCPTSQQLLLLFEVVTLDTVVVKEYLRF